MYPISTDIQALFEVQRKVLSITGTDKNGAAITITDDNVIADSFQIDRYCCNGEKLEIGTAIAAQLMFTLENSDGTYDAIKFEGAELNVRVGVADWTQANPMVYWVPCGYFTPDEQRMHMSTISITALDRMTKFDVVVDAADLTFPTTVAGLVGQVCSACGVTLANSITGLPNASVSIAELPTVQDTLTYRTLIQWCAGIMATNAWFDWNGKLQFTWFSNAIGGYASTVDNRYSSNIYKGDLIVSGVEYTTTGGVPIVEGTDDYDLDITGNALAGPLIATVLPVINEEVTGFIYRPFTASAVNAPYLWPMDGVELRDKDNHLHFTTLTNVTFGLNGATALEARGMTYVTNKAKYPKGFTREQAQLVNQAMEHVEQDIDESLTQQEIFNRLVGDPPAQGLVLYNGQLYINASYIQSGTLVLGGLNNQNGTLKVLNAAGQEIGTWTKDGININSGSVRLSKTSSGQTGRVTIQESEVNPIEVEYKDSSGRVLTTIGGINPIGIFTNDEDCRIGPHLILFQNNVDGAWFYAIKYNGVNSLYFKGDASINGALNVTDKATTRTNLGITPANIGAMPAEPPSIELNPPVGSGFGGYIDFHFNGSSEEYTTRLIEAASGQLTLLGSLIMSSPLGVPSGGTGATDADGARANIHAMRNPDAGTPSYATGNFNDAPTGFSAWYGSQNTVNHPFLGWATVLTMRIIDVYVQQIAFSWLGNQIAYRACDNGTWYAWKYITLS